MRSRYIKTEVLNKDKFNVCNRCINLNKYGHTAWCDCHIQLKFRISNSNCDKNHCTRSQIYEFDDLKRKFITVYKIKNKFLIPYLCAFKDFPVKL
jgi:hypothetical protein